MTTTYTHQSTTPETTALQLSKQHSTHQQTDTTTSQKTYKTNAHLCITIAWSGRSLSVTRPGSVATDSRPRVVDLGGWV